MKTGYYNIEPNVSELGSINFFYNGSKIEEIGYRGISHLVEHLICKAIDHIDEELISHGLKFNASTSENIVHFYLTGMNKHIKKFENEFIKILNYIPTKEEFDKEKLIVLAEYNNLFSKPNCIFQNISRKYFNRFGAIGYRTDIENITYEQYLEFQNNHFSKPLSIIRVGETEFSNYYKNLIYTKDIEKIYDYLDVGNEFLEYNCSTNNPLNVHWCNCNIKPIYQEFISLYLSNGLNSPLYQELREKNGLVYYVQSDILFDNLNSSPIVILYECQKKNSKKCQKLIRNLFKYFETNENRFDNMKKYIECTYEESEIFNHNTKYVKNFIEDVDYLNVYRELNFEKFSEMMNEFSETFLREEKLTIAGKEMKI